MCTTKLISYLEDIVVLTNKLAALQNEQGQIAKADEKKAIVIIEQLLNFLRSDQAAFISEGYRLSLIADITTWVDKGVDKQPEFGVSRDALELPDNGGLFYFLGPLRLANGNRNGWKFETFLSLRDEPSSPQYQEMYNKYPHPKYICQSSHLLIGSKGLMESNNIVFFPENIQSKSPVERQKYAVFFFNKFYRTYNSISVPVAETFFDKSFIKNRTKGNVQENYEARCVWGYLHDYYHHMGPRPFDEHIDIKTKWYSGLLEEIKVDLQTLLCCLQDETIPYRLEVAEFILVDRMFRYPVERNWSRNFDSGTGLLMLSWFKEAQALLVNKAGKMHLDLAQLEPVAKDIIDSITAIELLENSSYLAQARELVATHLCVKDRTKSAYFDFDFTKIGGNQFEKFYSLTGEVKYELEELIQPAMTRRKIFA
ncbi:DUF6421 family protein [Vibrio sp. Of7-15]|uniref:DUF6421 family protein n=1 Tax=Vibrio sp. Of7-15 TaxID=2724879 RepID=UPI001EF33F33|nr:DUF6421 family protein [Vibrio sp. Of7-15]MCG7498655.1 DUF6421 family protein [Vibrio sp. Of7-15]